MRWPWSKKKIENQKNIHEDNVRLIHRKPSKVPILSGVGCVVAGLSAAFLGDPTFGVATASVIGAIIGLSGTAHSYISGLKKLKFSDERIVVELIGINQSLRAMLLMVIFGGLAFGIKSGIDLFSKQFQIVDKNPLIFIAVVLTLAYFFIAKKAR